jgi:predicted alpha/beta superfamily hydrolase
MRRFFDSRVLVILVLPFFIMAAKAAPLRQVADTGAIINIAQFDMPQLNRQRTLRIYLPKDYNKSGKRYPVLYMLDGQNLFKSDAAIKSTWGLDSTLNSLPDKQQCIIIGVDHAGKDRITEYDPYDSRFGKGDGIAFTRFLAKTLKPYVDAHYRTKADPRYTAIAGSSMGSLLAMYAVLQYPKVFGDAGVFSPAFWIAPDIYKLAQSSAIGKQTGFYLTCGDKESENMVSQVNKMDSVLMAKGLSRKQVPPVKINAGFVHNELQWRTVFPAFFTWLTNRFK